MPVSKIAIGSPGELSHPDTFRAGVAEFISMLIFVFAGSGSGMAFGTYATSLLSFFLCASSCHPRTCSPCIACDGSQAD
jgi:hypothetical protein